MKSHFRRLLVLSLTIVMIGAGLLVSLRANADESSVFSLDSIPDDMTLAAALRVYYDELYQIFGIQRISSEEAQDLINSGVRILDIETENAKEFFSYFNYRKQRQ